MTILCKTQTLQEMQGLGDFGTFFKQLEHKAIIAGGFARYVVSYFNDEPVRPPLPADIDIFPIYNFDEVDRVVKLYATPTRDHPHAREYKFRSYLETIDLPLQVAYRARGDVYSLLDEFDFTASMYAIEWCNDHVMLYWDDRAPQSNKSRQLEVHYEGNPSGSIFRALGYAKKGYTLPVGQLIRLINLLPKHPESINYLDEMAYGRPPRTP